MAKTKKQPEVSKTGKGGKVESYGAKDIYVLEGLDPVRKRPGMYIGSTGPDGLHHLIWEVVDNSLDEAMAGYAKNIEITLLPDGKVKVSDDGRGIPVEKHKQTGRSALETVMTTLHAGGKFGGESYKVAAGLHGVGVSVVNALSVWLKAEVSRDGYLYEQEYQRGKAKKAVKKIGKANGSGTTVTVVPDPEIFKDRAFDWHRILTHLRQQAYLTKGTKIVINDQRSPVAISESEEKKGHITYPSHTFYFEGGIISYVQFLNRHEEPRHPNIFYAAKEQENIFVEVAFQYTGDIQGHELSFANNVHTLEGGMHITGFRSAITRTLNDYARKNNFLKEKDDNLTGEDIREGLTVIVSVKLKEPQFEGQTKAKLGTTEARTAVESVVNTELADWFDRHPGDGKEILGKVILAAKARVAAKAARDTVIRKGALEGFTLPGKLADCSSRKPEESELFIVEGESAGGCFSGDTKVALLDGRNISFKELTEEHERGKQNFCYTIGHDGQVAVAPVVNPRITGKNAKIVRVVLDNNQEITCTPDHKFMLRDGSYKEACSLTSDDSLMPLYRKHSKIGGKITIDGYEMVFNPPKHFYIFTHMLSDRYNLLNNAYKESNGPQRHHKDFNKLNNNPSNIIRLTREHHFKLHQEIANTVLRSPEVLAKLRKTKQSQKYKDKIRQSMLKLGPLLSARAKKQWANKEYKEYMADKFLAFYNSSEKYRKYNNELLNKMQKEYWASDDNRKKQAERTKTYFKNHPEHKLWLSKIASKQWQDEKLKSWRRQKTKEQWTKEFRVKRKKAYNQTYLNKALPVFYKIFKEEGCVNVQKYNQIRKEVNDKTLIRYDTILERFFNNDADNFNTAVKNYNHKIKKVAELSERADVYDMEVPETHNFALASGVFVHNSSKSGRDRRTQAILPLKGKILNVEKARIDRMLTSQEIRALVIAMGTAIADEFNIDKLRYHKIVIMTDADVDGAHIRTLLLTLFFRYFRELIDKGHVYIAQPPLYKIQRGRDIQYAYTEGQKNKILSGFTKDTKEDGKGGKSKAKDKTSGNGTGEWTVSPLDETAETQGEKEGVEEDPGETREKITGVSIQRYKGLGEMNPGQLWDTTMDPEKRLLLKVTIEDAEEADKIFDVLMGSDVLLRKKFIQTHAKDVKNLDIS